ncbi:phage tail assembly chaperone [Sphingomonas xinjiangensis]|uniref:Putative phage protein (TIGR02216 family) n=1 Tax=Sphingomonas xinjiangensis TaxID=643568 RepID=A0A840YHH3_9SPHN|nr:putative phage protein (TIGR02216 family) [Sphingomonas xinjiangensis]
MTGEDFGGCSARLAGLAGLVFGWSPDVFWNATPAELAALVGAARGEVVAPPGAAEVARLKELFPDG